MWRRLIQSVQERWRSAAAISGFAAVVALTVRFAGAYGFWAGARAQTPWGTSEPFAETLLYGAKVFCLMFALTLLIPSNRR